MNLETVLPKDGEMISNNVEEFEERVRKAINAAADNCKKKTQQTQMIFLSQSTWHEGSGLKPSMCKKCQGFGGEGCDDICDGCKGSGVTWK